MLFLWGNALSLYKYLLLEKLCLNGPFLGRVQSCVLGDAGDCLPSNVTIVQIILFLVQDLKKKRIVLLKCSVLLLALVSENARYLAAMLMQWLLLFVIDLEQVPLCGTLTFLV